MDLVSLVIFVFLICSASRSERQKCQGRKIEQLERRIEKKALISRFEREISKLRASMKEIAIRAEMGKLQAESHTRESKAAAETDKREQALRAEMGKLQVEAHKRESKAALRADGQTAS